MIDQHKEEPNYEVDMFMFRKLDGVFDNIQTSEHTMENRCSDYFPF